MAKIMTFMSVISMFILLIAENVRGDCKLPESCRNQQLCTEKPECYDEYVNDIHRKFQPIHTEFGLNNFEDTSTRIPYENTNGNCPFITSIKKPYHVNSTSQLVVQTDFYEQKIEVTECLYNSDGLSAVGETCFDDGVSFTINGSCKEKKISITLFMYDIETRKIQRVPVEIPVCCYCEMNSDF